MIRSKAALIEAMATTGARLHTGETFRTYVSAPGKESQVVHAGAFKALQDSLVQTADDAMGVAYRLAWIDEPTPSVAAEMSIQQQNDKGEWEEVGRARMSFPELQDELCQDEGCHSFPHVCVNDLPAREPCHMDGSKTAVVAQDELAFYKKHSAMSTLARFEQGFPNECVATGQTCAYGPHGRKGETQCEYCGAEPAAFNQAGHVDPVTGRRAMTIEQAAKYTLQEGERMHIYSKARALKKKDAWRRLRSIAHMEGAPVANVCWNGGGHCNMPVDRIVYIGA